jgi:hypothetical protein
MQLLQTQFDNRTQLQTNSKFNKPLIFMAQIIDQLFSWLHPYFVYHCCLTFHVLRRPVLYSSQLVSANK